MPLISGLATAGSKVAFYLDPVGKDTGSLRFIPGSRRLSLPHRLRDTERPRCLVQSSVD